MKRKFLSVICTFIAALIISTVFFSGCFLDGCFGGDDKNDDEPEDNTPKEYVIQYTDDVGTHKLTVTDGMPYSLDVVPEKTGYEFLGLYDEVENGTQYVSASGSSVSPFNDGENKVLYPQFKAKEYTFILDYQGAAVTGTRQLTVEYGSSLPELPKNLASDHKEFKGWYTQAECGGTQIADEYGLLPLVSNLNAQNFDVSSSSITLYAGFETEKHTVTFCFEAGMDNEEMQVAYNTPISQVVPKTRVDGKAVLTWSKTHGGEVWNDKVTGDTVLYAKEYAPVIELDSNGGDDVTPLVARAGSTIALPTPTKDLAKFSYWEDMSGNRYEETTMPESSISLKAVWQAKLVFDENGGSDVDDISVAAGNNITLPSPEKEGFLFAGWYTKDKEQYTSITMPSSGVKLKAGWYKEKKVKIVNDKEITINPSGKNICVDLSNEISITESVRIKFEYTFSSWQGITRDDTYLSLYMQIFSENTSNSAYAITDKKTFPHNNISGYQNRSYTEYINISKSSFYIRFTTSAKYNSVYIKNQVMNIYCPDTTNLYL